MIISCRSIEDEVTSAMQECGCTSAVFWMDSGLHSRTNMLRASIQAELDVLGIYDHILIAMGYCGSAVAGLESRDSPIVIPRVDDCISLLLGSNRRKFELTEIEDSYFMTRGWLRSDHNIYCEYKRTIEKYGATLAEQVFASIMGHYQSVTLVDTGCFPFAETCNETEAVARALHLGHHTVSGNLDVLRRLIGGSWCDDDFLIVPPHTRITDAMLGTGGHWTAADMSFEGGV